MVYIRQTREILTIRIGSSDSEPFYDDWAIHVANMEVSSVMLPLSIYVQ